MKRVSGYQTTDGKIFTSEQKVQAREHQKALNVIDGLTAVGNRLEEDDDVGRDDRGNPVLFAGVDFARFVMKHADDIKDALNGKFERPVPETV